MAILFIFVLTYIGIALGRIPGLSIDRTGFALIGAIAMVALGFVPFQDAIQTIHFPTILLLYGLMIVSAQLRLGGFYTRIVSKTVSLLSRPRTFLFILMIISGFLSAILANDIICFAFTPVLTYALLKARYNPIPFLLGLAVSSNIGSAATIMGNPQNMLIGQTENLPFLPFLIYCAPPSLLSLFFSYGVIVFCYRNTLSSTDQPIPKVPESEWPEFRFWHTLKGLLAATTLIVLFFTPIPREISAIAVAGILLCSRTIRTKRILGLVDWHLITLFCALFIVIHGIASSGWLELLIMKLQHLGIDLNSLPVLATVTTLVSNVFSNVPAAMLLLRFINSNDPTAAYILALSSTFAGNLFILGSIANLIVIEQAKIYGVVIKFTEHARVGVPITLISLLTAIVWIYL
ncbi:anion transporter [bacterium]|nr:anion transporter [candidate division CSSED10-310 bacterium]